MDPLLTVSYVVHVVSAVLFAGATLYVVYAVLPAARRGEFEAGAFGVTVDRLLRVARWTALSLPLTGAYQVLVLYPGDALVETTRGHLVLGMAALWLAAYTAIEAGVYRMLTVDGAADTRAYLVTGYLAGGGSEAAVDRTADAGRPYLLAAAALSALLLVDAALLNVVA